MNIIDLSLIVMLIIAGVVGYYRGFLKELYGLIILILSVVIAFLLKDVAYNISASQFDIGKMFDLNIAYSLSSVISKMIGPTLGFITILGICLTIFPIIKFILIKAKVIPYNNEKYKYLGIIISSLKTIFLFTVLAFILSFTTFVPGLNIYNDSKFLKPILKINPILNNISNNIHGLYSNFGSLNEKLNNYNNNPSQENIDQLVGSFKEMKESGVLTDDIIVDTSTALIGNTENNIDLSGRDFTEFKQAINESEYYPLIKEFYDEQILTPDLIVKIADANNVSGITEDNVKSLFQQ